MKRILKKSWKYYPVKICRYSDFVIAWMMKLCIFLYHRMISPLLGGNCRFYPSCSEYSMQVIEKFGAVKGGWLAVRRLIKCHPFHTGGYDPTPKISIKQIKTNG